MLQTLKLDRDAIAALARRAPQWVAGLLVLLLGIRVAYVVTDYAGAGAKTSAAASGGAVSLPARRARLDLAGLIGANLFGSAASAQQGPAPVTSMALVLVGVLAGEDPQRGVAILGPSAPAAKVYLVGSTLPGGALLHAVYRDRVLLDRGGSIEALMLPRQQSSGSAAALPAPTASTGERMQQLMQQNPGIMQNIIRPQVVLADGQQKGFRVFPGPNRKAFDKLGLRPGDLVTAINGTALDDPALGGNVFATLSAAANARVGVVRDGRQQDVVINVAQAVAEAERLSSEPAAQAAQDSPVPAQ